MSSLILAVVVPCYNECLVLEETSKQLSAVLSNLIDTDKISDKSFILFINDGSKDITWEKIQELYKSNKFVRGLNLAGNVGHQNALIAGLSVAKNLCDIIISIDADLQDDVQVINQMVLEYNNGFDIVYGVRDSRKTDTFFKRNTALGFYKFMSMLGVKSVYNHADFRLMSKRAVEQLMQFRERNLYLRGIVPLIGYNATTVYYNRNERFAGESKYPLTKLINLAANGITSFSVKPVRFILLVGFLFLLLSIFAAIYTLISYFIGNVVQGWTSMILSIWFIGALILISIGIVGEYIGKIYLEVKDRPRFNIESILLRDEARQSK
ncbi:MAG: glycosyltransferase family 2 protein [Opitutaceae bacterium]